MEQKYDEWNIIQKKLAKSSTLIFCNQREIWWCSIGMNIGTELYGKHSSFERPVLIMKVFNKETVMIVPLTSKYKIGIYYCEVKFGRMISYAMLSQVRTVSTRRLSRKIGRMLIQDFEEVLNRYISMLI